MSAKYFELTSEEKKLLKEIEAGRLIRVKNYTQAKREIIRAAKNTLNKNRNINIRLSEKVLVKLKAKAVKQGIPYQTLASSVLHQFVGN